MSWIIGTSTDYIALSNDIVTALTGSSLQTVDSIVAAGTGYTVGDVLTLDDGTATIDAQLEVTAESSGVITAVRIYNAGSNYTVVPGDPVGVTGGTGGDDATFNLTFAAIGWTAERDTAYSGSEREVILNGEGDGGDEIFIGWRTFSSVPGDYYNWELNGFTGFDSGLDTTEQPGVSPGLFDAASASFRAGSYLPLQNSSMNWWLSVDSYGMILEVAVGSSRFSAILTWGDRYATEAEFPYPLIIGGCVSAFNAQASSSDLRSGLSDPWRTAGSEGQTAGPMFLRDPAGNWVEVRNASISGSTKTADGHHVVIPTGKPSGADNAAHSLQADRYLMSDADFDELIPIASATGTPTANINPTPGTADAHVRFPCSIVFGEISDGPQIMCDIPRVFWVSGFGSIGNEDRIIEGSPGTAYRVFQNCNRTEAYAFLAITEA